MYDLGLKDFFVSSRKEKIKLRHFFRELRWELRYAWRRAWIGYDDVDMFECFEMFRKRMFRILEDFIKHGHGLLNLPQESEHYNEYLQKKEEIPQLISNKVKLWIKTDNINSDNNTEKYNNES